jgi:acyl-[acyl-carrier-protein]-phospholipid O-acyltransferase / long-chain-fatty-acid--[acyl-carrier-protein] ligase
MSPEMPSAPFDASLCQKTVFSALLDQMARRGPKTEVIFDAEGQTLTYRRLVLGSWIIGRKLAKRAPANEPVGVLLPNVSALVVTLLGLNAHRRTAALLNFTAGVRNLKAAIQTAPLSTIVTSRRFVAASGLEETVAALAKEQSRSGEPIDIVYLEDLRQTISIPDKMGAMASTLRARQKHRRFGGTADDIAVILFTSGTEGLPKGVALTNANLTGNAAQIFAHADAMLTTKDIVLNPLPMFHSFGLTAATLMPLLNGLKVVLYPSPLHYKQIPKLIKKSKATVVFATDTFLQGYGRAADIEDLLSVRYVIAGAERVKEKTRGLWRAYNTTILEGYGATECSPVIACNLPDNNQPGTVGPVLPGMTTRLEPVPGIDEGGRLFVKGPNVMAGYIHADRPGKVVPPQDGWHDTGDIVTLENEVITIRGRAKRFAKIGGEMVSLAAVEVMANELWDQNTHVADRVSDPRKGESLVLVTDKPDATIDALQAFARQAGISELWVPRRIVQVPAIPVLGSGKIDLSATHKLVLEKLQPATAEDHPPA